MSTPVLEYLSRVHPDLICGLVLLGLNNGEAYFEATVAQESQSEIVVIDVRSVQWLLHHGPVIPNVQIGFFWVFGSLSNPISKYCREFVINGCVSCVARDLTPWISSLMAFRSTKERNRVQITLSN